MAVTLLHGDCVETMAAMEAASIDSIVTDPPAGISFMNRHWDGDKGGRDLWIAWMQQVAAEALRVAKPGAHALVWALPRTSHWTATAWENAGWEVRDRVSHLFGSGFPKSLLVDKAIDKAAGAEREVIGASPYAGRAGSGRSKEYTFNVTAQDTADGRAITAPATPEAQQWAGWGTALKPACEDWWLLRKPLGEKTVAANVLAHGTGAINIDACRINPGEAVPGGGGLKGGAASRHEGWKRPAHLTNEATQPHNLGRWPANICHDGSDEVLEAFAAFGERRGGGHTRDNSTSLGSSSGGIYGKAGGFVGAGHNDTGSAARFYYCAKASKAERNQSKHPTQKPLSLMRWITRLITPPGGRVLDPFAGSGTTGVACLREGFDCVLIEAEAEYVETIKFRLGEKFQLEAAD